MLIFDKKKLLKYGEYLKETLDPWKLKIGIKSFNRLPDDKVTIHGDLKNLSEELQKEFNNISLPYSKLLIFGGIEIDLKVKLSNRYYSNIDWLKFLVGDYEIVIEVIDDFDKDYIISLVIHEIRHMIDFSDENINSGLSSFDVDQKLRKYNIGDFTEFFKLVYISLEHELVARNNQIYPYIKFENLKKEESLSILKNSFIWQSLVILRNFEYLSFIKKFNESELIEITNNFIKDCLKDNDDEIKNMDDLLNFFRVWDEFFHETADKWEKNLMKEIEVIYERKQYSIEHSTKAKNINIIREIWNNIKKKISLRVL